MPIEYEMMYLKNTVVDAIKQFSQNTGSAAWINSIEDAVLDIVENDPDAMSKFKDYQVLAMRELVSRGYWIKWDEEMGCTVLRRLPYRNDK
jgi:hypothetical protein